MRVLGIDTATAATVVGLANIAEAEPGEPATWTPYEARHDPDPGERPGHATRLLGLVEEVLGENGWDRVERIAVGVGPGSFTGLRIGISTARALAQARGLELVGVSTLEALALGAGEELAVADPAAPSRPHLRLAVIDARRGEAFAAAWDAHGRQRLATAARTPAVLARAVSELGAPVLAVGDGALRFHRDLEAAGADIPADDSGAHRVAGRHLCRLGARATGAGAVVPDYQRIPDAELRTPGAGHDRS